LLFRGCKGRVLDKMLSFIGFPPLAALKSGEWIAFYMRIFVQHEDVFKFMHRV